jgi:hypothetical protein
MGTRSGGSAQSGFNQKPERISLRHASEWLRPCHAVDGRQHPAFPERIGQIGMARRFALGL